MLAKGVNHNAKSSSRGFRTHHVIRRSSWGARQRGKRAGAAAATASGVGGRSCWHVPATQNKIAAWRVARDLVHSAERKEAPSILMPVCFARSARHHSALMTLLATVCQSSRLCAIPLHSQGRQWPNGKPCFEPGAPGVGRLHRRCATQSCSFLRHMGSMAVTIMSPATASSSRGGRGHDCVEEGHTLSGRELLRGNSTGRNMTLCAARRDTCARCSGPCGL